MIGLIGTHELYHKINVFAVTNKHKLQTTDTEPVA